jgi:hypothetical protein
MKVYKKNASVISDALNFWKAENLIDADQADKLNNSLEVVGFDCRKLSILIILSSIFFFFIASTGFIEVLIKYFENNKIIVSFIIAAIDILFYVLGAYSKAKWTEKFYSSNGLFFLGVLFTPCAILIFFAALHGNEIEFDVTSSYFPNVILISCIIYTVLGILLKSKLIWCVSLISFGCWISTQINYYYVYVGFPLVFVLLGSTLVGVSELLIKPRLKIAFLYKPTLIVGLFYVFTSLWVMSIFGNGNPDSWDKIIQFELLHWLLIFTAATLRAIYYGMKYNDSVVCNFGVTFFIINLYTRSFEYFWNNVHYSVFFTILGISLWIIAIKAEKIFNMSSIYNKPLVTYSIKE